MKRILLLVLAILALSTAAMAQKAYSWKHVDSLIALQKYNSAYNLASGWFEKAFKEHNSREMLNATSILNDLDGRYRESAFDSAMFRIQKIIPHLDKKHRPVAQYLLLNNIQNYYQNHSHIISRQEHTDEQDIPYTEWDSDRFQDTIKAMLSRIMLSASQLQAMRVEDYPYLLEHLENHYLSPSNDSNSVLITLTLWDVVCWEQLCINQEEEISILPLSVLAEKDLEKNASIPEKINILWAKAKQKEPLASQLHIDIAKILKINQFIRCDSNAIRTFIHHYVSQDSALKDLKSLYLQLANRLEGENALKVHEYILEQYPNTYESQQSIREINRIKNPGFFMEVYAPMASTECVPVTMGNLKNLQQIRISIFNTSRYSFNIAEYQSRHTGIEFVSQILKVSPDTSFIVDINALGNYQPQSKTILLPPLPQGKYIVMAQVAELPNDSILCYSLFEVNDIFTLRFYNEDNLEGVLLHRSSGKPLANHEIKVLIHNSENSKKTQNILTTRTDELGRFEFQYPKSKNQFSYTLQTRYNGYLIEERGYRYHHHSNKKGKLYKTNFFLDRPIFKPGDTLQFAAVTQIADTLGNNKPMKNTLMEVNLMNVNRKIESSLKLTSDDFGMIHGTFVIPQDCLNGQWQITCKFKDPEKNDHHCSEYFTVESYKEPTFTISFSCPKGMHPFNKPLTFNGFAKSYTGAALSGAKIAYEICADEWNPLKGRIIKKIVAQDALKLSKDGFFEFQFIPQQDSLHKESTKSYGVKVTITDLNGETHEESIYVSVYEVPAMLSLTTPGSRNNILHEGEKLSLKYQSHDWTPLQDSVEVTIYRLKVPEEMKPRPSGLFEGLSPEEASKAPYWALRDEDHRQYLWESTQEWTLKVVSTSDPATIIPLPEDMGFGIFKIRLSAPNADTVTETITLVAKKDGKIFSNQPFQILSKGYSSAKIGDTLRVEIGSSMKGLTLFYLLEEKELEYHKIELNNEITTLSIPTTPEMEGNLRIVFFALKENTFRNEYIHFHISKNNELKITTKSFRDKVVAGDIETWTFSTSQEGNSSANSLLTNSIFTLYDAALDAVGGSNTFHLSPILNQEFKRINIYSSSSQTLWCSSINKYKGIAMPKYLYPASDFRSFNFRNVQMYELEVLQIKSARGIAPKYAELEEEEEIEMEEAVIINELNVIDEEPEPQNSTSPITLRSDLRNLAFFKPNIRSNAEGEFQISFTMPERLTQWNLKGVSWTQEFKTGDFSSKVVSSKELMVVPNAPRFMREGDTILFPLKVTNLSDKDQNFEVSLSFKDALHNKEIRTYIDKLSQKHLLMILEENGSKVEVSKKLINVPAMESRMVDFRVVVPTGIGLVNYEATASNDHFSDGETAPIPILTNRKLITESMILYMNPEDSTKHYTFSHLKNSSSSTLQNHSLTLEYTSNPLWYAILAMPYAEQHKSPSNIYLANEIYLNAMGNHIVKENPIIAEVFTEWEKGNSPETTSNLFKNEKLKETLLEQSPWLLNAQSEDAQHQKVAMFFNPNKLQKELSQLTQKLRKNQLADGSWSWIPGKEKGDLFSTKYILKRFGEMQLQGVETGLGKAITKALEYVNNEEYNYYVKYIKKRSFECSPTNIDYLYLRSLFPQEKSNEKVKEMYDFYYKNAVKNLNQFTSLYSKAQVAIVLQRKGDHKLAQKLIEEILESALTDDEMGIYWRDNQNGFFWHQQEIETQSMIIQAVGEVSGDWNKIRKMQQWLLKKKQTTHWGSDIATSQAISALLLSDDKNEILDASNNPVEIRVGGNLLEGKTEKGTGYQMKEWNADEFTKEMANVDLCQPKERKGISWGAMYWQYFEDLDKIESHSEGIRIEKKIYKIVNDKNLLLVTDTSLLRVGDKVRVKVWVRSDRDLDFLQIKDQRASALEPISSASGWHWNNGLSYYLEVKDCEVNCFVDHMEKGEICFWYDLYVNHGGNFSNGVSSAQCMYVPQFVAHSKGVRLQILPQE